MSYMDTDEIEEYRQNESLGNLIESKKIFDNNEVNKNKKIIARTNVIVDYILLEEITFFVNKFWTEIPSQVKELAKRLRFLIN